MIIVYIELCIALLGATIIIMMGKKFPNKLGLVIFFYFSCVVYFVAIRGNRFGISGISIKFPLPFLKAIMAHHYGPTTHRSVLNVILFIPFGYLLPRAISIYKNNNPKWWTVAIAGFLLSLLIETSQITFHFGVFELDDLVKNTMGAIIGYIVWYVLERRQNQ